MKTKKFLFPVMAVVLVVALVGVGFAAWTIISPVTVDDVTGSFVSEKLEDHSFTLSTKIDAAEEEAVRGNVAYGLPKLTEDNATGRTYIGEAVEGKYTSWVDGYSWYSHDGAMAAEKLSTTVEVVMTPTTSEFSAEVDVDYFLQGRKVKVVLDYLGIEDNAESAAYFKTAVDNGYLAYPEMYVNEEETARSNTIAEWSEGALYLYLDAEDFVKDVSSNTATATITVKFAWGTDTEAQNPLAYYNARSKNSDTAQNELGTGGALVHGFDTATIEAVDEMMKAVANLKDAQYKLSFEAHVCADGDSDGKCDGCVANVE